MSDQVPIPIPRCTVDNLVISVLETKQREVCSFSRKIYAHPNLALVEFEVFKSYLFIFVCIVSGFQIHYHKAIFQNKKKFRINHFSRVSCHQYEGTEEFGPSADSRARIEFPQGRKVARKIRNSPVRDPEFVHEMSAVLAGTEKKDANVDCFPVALHGERRGGERVGGPPRALLRSSRFSDFAFSLLSTRVLAGNSFFYRREI